MQNKRELIKMVFDEARKALPRGTTNSLADYLNVYFEEEFGFSKNERTFVRYYKKLVVENCDYNIDEITLDQLSVYAGFENYEQFCKKIEDGKSKNAGPVKITVVEGENSATSFAETMSNIVINITNAPVFTFPEFISHHKNSFGLVGILLLVGFIANQSGYFQKETAISVEEKKNTKEIEMTQNPTVIPQRLITNFNRPENKISPVKILVPERKKECMYWKEDHYEAIFCDEKVQGTNIIALDEAQFKLLKKINLTDTLTVENSLGKVWYDKSNNQLDFFTNFGIHPVNGKTLRPITKHIIETHIE